VSLRNPSSLSAGMSENAADLQDALAGSADRQAGIVGVTAGGERERDARERGSHLPDRVQFLVALTLSPGKADRHRSDTGVSAEKDVSGVTCFPFEDSEFPPGKSDGHAVCPAPGSAASVLPTNAVLFGPCGRRPAGRFTFQGEPASTRAWLRVNRQILVWAGTGK